MSEKELDQVSKQIQDHYKDPPVIILGSGASAALGMSSMWLLSKHLMSTVKGADLSDEYQALWDKFCCLLKADVDLETALHKVSLSFVLTERVGASTWSLLTTEDIAIFNCSLINSDLFPLGRLLKHFFRSTLSQLNIITPNYDRLAEYACEQEQIHHFTGFSHGCRGTFTTKEDLKSERRSIYRRYMAL